MGKRVKFQYLRTNRGKYIRSRAIQIARRKALGVHDQAALWSWRMVLSLSRYVLRYGRGIKQRNTMGGRKA